MAKGQRGRRRQDMTNIFGFGGRLRKAKLFGILILFIFLFCQKYNEEFEPQLNVFCILKNNRPYQKVVVDRIYGMDEKSIYDLEDVQVILSGNGICDTLVEDSILGVFVTRDTFPVVHSQTYHLQVSAKGFDTIRGVTTVPDSFEIIFPEDGDTVQLLDTMIIKWKNRHQWVRLELYYQDSLLCWNFYGMVGDTILELPFWSCLYDTGYYRLMVGVYDSNYVNYNIDASKLQCGIENGIGLFGSAFMLEAEFYYQ